MLELDILFESFLDQTYPTLPVDQKRDFVRLLTFVDPLIMAWVMGDDTPEEPAMAEMIRLLSTSTGQRRE
jgi:succinate dehydrogenase flavin-adding protein (antitoxin of CptAB toxin-antitoxin module)